MRFDVFTYVKKSSFIISKKKNIKAKHIEICKANDRI